MSIERVIEITDTPLPPKRNQPGKYSSLSCKLATRPGSWAEVVDMEGNRKALNAARRRWAEAGRRHGWEVQTRMAGSHLAVYARWPKGQKQYSKLAMPYKEHFRWVKAPPDPIYGQLSPVREALIRNEGLWAIVRREPMSTDPNEVARMRGRLSRERDNLSELKGISAAVRVVDDEMRVYARYLRTRD